MTEALHHIDGHSFRTFAQAYQHVRTEKGYFPPINDLEVARRFDALYPKTTSYLLHLPYSEDLPIPSFLLVTDPTVAAKFLKEHEFKEIHIDTFVRKGFNPPIRGNFILHANNQAEWKHDRMAISNSYSPVGVRDMQEKLIVSAESAVEAFVTTDGSIHPLWTKQLIGYQTVRQLVGSDFNMDHFREAMRSHALFSNSSLVPLATGLMGDYVHSAVRNTILKPYLDFLDELSAANAYDVDSPLAHIAHNAGLQSPEAVRDATATLVAGLNLQRALLDNCLYMLARHPHYQEIIREDPSTTIKVIQETGRIRPPIPYVLRTVVEELDFMGEKIPASSLLMIGVFAYGGEKYVENAHSFNPERNGLAQMANNQDGQANIFSAGPRTCIARHVAPAVLSATLNALIKKFDVYCDNDPDMVVGGISLQPTKTFQFRLKDRHSGFIRRAPSSYLIRDAL